MENTVPRDRAILEEVRRFDTPYSLAMYGAEARTAGGRGEGEVLCLRTQGIEGLHATPLLAPGLCGDRAPVVAQEPRRRPPRRADRRDNPDERSGWESEDEDDPS